MIPKEEERVVPARIQAGGRLLYFGRRPASEARAIESAKRAEYKRTGRVTGARTTRPAPGYTPPDVDPMEVAVESDELPKELQLMLAVFEDACDCLSSTSAQARLEAERWFASNDRSHIYAFATICDVFGVDVLAARRWVARGRN